MMRRVLGCILMAGMIAVMLPTTLRADSNVADPAAIFPIVPDARGVRLHGQLAIYYDEVAELTLGCGTFEVNMFFVFRLRKGDDAPAGFAGSLKPVCYEASEEQIPAVMAFVGSNVVPFFFPNGFSDFALKSVNVVTLVQDGQTQLGPPFFFLMNVEFRVRR